MFRDSQTDQKDNVTLVAEMGRSSVALQVLLIESLNHLFVLIISCSSLSSASHALVTVNVIICPCHKFLFGDRTFFLVVPYVFR